MISVGRKRRVRSPLEHILPLLHSRFDASSNQRARKECLKESKDLNRSLSHGCSLNEACGS